MIETSILKEVRILRHLHNISAVLIPKFQRSYRRLNLINFRNLFYDKVLYTLYLLIVLPESQDHSTISCDYGSTHFPINQFFKNLKIYQKACFFSFLHNRIFINSLVFISKVSFCKVKTRLHSN